MSKFKILIPICCTVFLILFMVAYVGVKKKENLKQDIVLTAFKTKEQIDIENALQVLEKKIKNLKKNDITMTLELYILNHDYVKAYELSKTATEKYPLILEYIVIRTVLARKTLSNQGSLKEYQEFLKNIGALEKKEEKPNFNFYSSVYVVSALFNDFETKQVYYKKMQSLNLEDQEIDLLNFLSLSTEMELLEFFNIDL